MISFSSVSLQRGLKSLLLDASFSFYPGQKIGIVGDNGVGKSTIFSVIKGELTVDKGNIDVPSSFRIAHSSQEIIDIDIAIVDYVKSGSEKLFEIESEINLLQLDTFSSERSLDRLTNLYEEFELLGGYQFSSDTEKLLFNLGFTEADLSKKISDLSGGWRVRLNLAKALISSSDILLLDEPTNHLDIETIFWLESWLKAYKGMVLIISHDVVFLDNVVDNIACVDQKKVTVYKGDFSTFQKTKNEEIELNQKSFRNQKKSIEHIESFVTRFKAKASKAKQVQSRIKMLEKITRIDLGKGEASFDFSFLDEGKFSDGAPLISMSKVLCGYEAGAPVLKNIDLSILSGMKIGLLGINGAGKSTMIKTLAGELDVLSGSITRHCNLKVGYFEQHSIEGLNLNWTPLDHFFHYFSDSSETDLRIFLGSFGFSNEMALTCIKIFSGGEKARLSLALIVYSQPNILIFDEPTNHLDFKMRQALIRAIQGYSGAIIIVSHDRLLLESSVDMYYLLENQAVNKFPGDLADYHKHVCKNRVSLKDNTSDRLKLEYLQKKELRKNSKIRSNKLAKIEREIDNLSVQLNSVTKNIELLSTGACEVYGISLNQEIEKYDSIKAKLEVLENTWLELSEDC